MRIILAPSNLGLRPLRPGHQPGAWRAPEVLMQTGLATLSADVEALPRPVYSVEAQPGTRIRNGPVMRVFNLALAERVEDCLRAGQFALVVGGDCSVLLGALAGARRLGPLALIHADGHSDFRHPGNYDFAQSLGAAAGMDLALATGRGEALMTDWPGASCPLVQDRDVVQLGEREGRNPDFAWPDVNETGIERIDVFEANQIGVAAVVARIRGLLQRRPGGLFWVHLDVDVLDQAVMWAVDSPGSPRIAPDELEAILRGFVRDPGCVGMTVTVYDPDLDPGGECARLIVEIVGRLLDGAAARRD